METPMSRASTSWMTAHSSSFSTTNHQQFSPFRQRIQPVEKLGACCGRRNLSLVDRLFRQTASCLLSPISMTGSTGIRWKRSFDVSSPPRHTH
ncbi:hypothetical protein BDN72DRAFT_320194 [Pluteus cervinus]|uniref:Uncharacterized protein n=1 Tax=Pluteus cervinus TaxID=181527 RepID=A0ACD3AC65_9AGAR|nr:hypothetical protein BDN72DRAFT_320194 [Pluteus cervinus]